MAVSHKILCLTATAFIVGFLSLFNQTVAETSSPLSVKDFILDRATYANGSTKAVEGVVSCLGGPSTCLLFSAGGDPMSSAHINVNATNLPRDDRRRLLDYPDTQHKCRVIVSVYIAPDGTGVSLDLQYLQVTKIQWLTAQ